MSRIDKTSVRDEFDRLKRDFKDYSSSKKVPNELSVIINGLFTIM